MGPLGAVGKVLALPLRLLGRGGGGGSDMAFYDNPQNVEVDPEADEACVGKGMSWPDGRYEPGGRAMIHPDDAKTPDQWVPRHPSLIRLTGKHPFNCEPPLAECFAEGFITPSPLHYVRNHGACPKLDWATHRIEVKGNVRRKLSISMDELVKMPSYSFPCLLVCAGNRRKEQNMIKKSIGFNWGPCATATSWWTGVRLADILKRAGVTKAGPGRRFVCFAGPQRELPQTYDGQQGGPGSYGTSIDIETALDPACDIMVAYKQNGELLHPDHGFPVRLLIPGYIGGRMIKWLCEIEVTDEESNNFYHFNDNRVLPVGVDVERANREGWWFKPEYIINELNINAAIAYPAHGETISAAKPSYKLQGYAYSGGGRKVTRVEVSLDQGQSWQLAEVTVREKPRWGKGVSGAKAKWWCWCFWELAVPVKAIAGANEICLRAWDEAQNSMPDTPTWNVMGMMNNPWYRVRVHSAGHGILRFEHPTQAGPDKEEGWMVQMAQKAPDGVLNWGWGGKGGPAAPPRPDLSPA